MYCVVDVVVVNVMYVLYRGWRSGDNVMTPLRRLEKASTPEVFPLLATTSAKLVFSEENSGTPLMASTTSSLFTLDHS